VPVARFQAWLDRQETTFFEDDFEAYAATCALPMTLVTMGGTTRVGDLAALRAGFEASRDRLRAVGATALVRSARAVDPCRDGAMVGRFDTRILAGARLLRAPFGTEVTLIGSPDAWRIVHVVSDLSPFEHPLAAPRPGPSRPDDAPLTAPGG